MLVTTKDSCLHHLLKTSCTTCHSEINLSSEGRYEWLETNASAMQTFQEQIYSLLKERTEREFGPKATQKWWGNYIFETLMALKVHVIDNI